MYLISFNYTKTVSDLVQNLLPSIPSIRRGEASFGNTTIVFKVYTAAVGTRIALKLELEVFVVKQCYVFLYAFLAIFDYLKSMYDSMRDV
jgi:hypothetical protein